MAINIISRQIVLDVYKHERTDPVTINAIAADNDTRYVAAEIQYDGARYDVGSSAVVELIALRPDKVGVGVTGSTYAFTEENPGSYNPETDEYTPGETITYYGVYAELDQAVLAKKGKVLGQFKITSGDQVLHTEVFVVNTGRALDAETSEWAGEYQGYNLDELVQDVSTLNDNLNSIQNTVEAISQAPISIAYVTNGVSATHYGVTYSKNSNNVLALYGTSTGLGYFNVFNGNDDYTNGGSIAPDHNLSAGTYTVYFTGTEELKLEICYTESTYSSRTVLTSGQTLNVGANGGTIFARIYKSKDYGTAASPTLLTLEIYEGADYVPVMTAVDYTARRRIGIIANDSPYNHGFYNVYKTDFAEWYQGLNADYSTYGFGHDTTYAQILTLFDALVSANPNYITKNAIGSGSGAGYTIYEYVFKPTEIIATKNTRKMPKILINCGIHGFEKNGVFGTYCFLKDLCEKWEENKTLEAIRHFVELRVVPVSNPYGFDNDIRENANGVNINRNFPCDGWTADTDTGVAPLDQPESAAIASWVSNNADALYFLDVHTNGHYNVTGYEDANFCMTFDNLNDTYFNRIFPVLVRHIERQTYKFADEFNLDMGTSLFGHIHTEDETSGSLGTLKKYCTEYLGTLMSMTYELFNGISIDGTTVVTAHSAQSIQMCSELIGNMLAEILTEFGN